MRRFKWTVSKIKKSYLFEIRLSDVTEELKYLILQAILLSLQYIALHLSLMLFVGNVTMSFCVMLLID